MADNAEAPQVLTRDEEEAVCMDAFYSNGAKYGAIYGVAGVVGVAALWRFAPSVRSYLPMPTRVFVATSAAVAGFWIGGEVSTIQCQRHYRAERSRAERASTAARHAEERRTKAEATGAASSKPYEGA